MAKKTLLLCVLMWLLESHLAFAAEGSPRRFESERHFPPGPLAYVSIHNVSQLKARLSETLCGKMLTHPGVGRAFRGLSRQLMKKLDEEWAPFVEVMGKTPLEILGLFQGEVALTWKGFGVGGIPEVALAVELGETRGEILGLIDRLKKVYEGATGQSPPLRTVEGVRATLWPTPAGEAVHGVLGTHLVLTSSAGLFQSLAANYRNGASASSGESLIDPKLLKELAVKDRQALFFLNVAAVRNFVLGMLAQAPEMASAPQALRLSGFDAVTHLCGSIGFDQGGMEGVLHLGTQGPTGGLLGILKAGLPPLEKPGEVFSQIPSNAQRVQAIRLRPGKMLSDLDAFVRTHIPELGGQLSEAYRALEKYTSISVEKDLKTLSEVTCYSFSVPPPAGGLFQDQVVLLRTKAVNPYWKILGNVAELAGAEFRTLESDGARVEYLDLSSSPIAREGLLMELLEGGGWNPSTREMLVMATAGMGLAIARTDLPGGWTAVSTFPQALLRHRMYYAKGPKLSDDSEMAAFAREAMRGQSAATVSRGAQSILWMYNSALSLAAQFSPILALVGIDTAQLPPAEFFLDNLRPGYLTLEIAPEGLTLRGHRAFESGDTTLAVVGSVAMVASIVTPTLVRGRSEAYKVQCANNLKQLYMAALIYSDEMGTRAFPYSPKGSLASLQILIDSEPGGLRPEVFVCPEGMESPAYVQGGTWTLQEDNCSYEIVSRKTKNTAPDRMLMYDKRPHHKGGRNVIFTDGRIRFLQEDEFQKRWAKERPASR